MADESVVTPVEETVIALKAARERVKHYERALNFQMPMGGPLKAGAAAISCRIQRWALIVEMIERETEYEVTP